MIGTSLLLAALATVTERVDLDANWSFVLNDAAPRTVSAPHDWSIEGELDAAAPTGKEWGFYPCGTGVFTRTFELSADDLAAELTLVFDGVLGETTVSVNGGPEVRGALYDYAGFDVPLKGCVQAGQNTVRVTVRNSRLPASRWYRGSGLCRGVRLEKRRPGALRARSLDVRVTELTDESATVLLSGERLTADGGYEPVTETRTIAQPIAWTPETPHLYRDTFCGEPIRYGLRTVAVDATKGFRLNGKTLKMHGACVHHDHGPLGAASWPEAEYRKARQLKDAGFNAVRTSHNPVSESFLDACDELGLLVMDDLFDGRQKAKTKGDYCEVFEKDWPNALDRVVRRDRVHPSVVMWSVGNEVLERSEPRAAEMTRQLKAFVDKLDGTRPVTQALCLWGEVWTDQDAMAAALDVVGYNYLEHFTESDHERLPNRVIVYTETYPKDATMVWRRIQANPYVIGEFVWTGIDYLGESGIGRNFYTDREKWGEHYHNIPQFPFHGATCGDIDLTGGRRPVSLLRETLWNPGAPTKLAVREPDKWKGTIATSQWSVWPTYEHWTFPGWEDREITAEIYSRQPRVRLLLNGQCVAERENGADNAWQQAVTLKYAPGELVAEGLDAAGKVVDRAVLKTAGAPVDVRYTRETFGRLTYVTAEIVDAAGTVCPNADREIRFEGNVLATCSADMTDTVVATSPVRRTYQGRALAIVKTK